MHTEDGDAARRHAGPPPRSAASVHPPPRHPATRLALEQLATAFPPYQPTHRFAGASIDAAHAALAGARRRGDLVDLGIPGWLRPADALKLYGPAYFSDGDVLETGCYHGLSTRIQVDAPRNAARGRRLVSPELRAEYVAEAGRTTSDAAELRSLVVGDARDSCAMLRRDGRQFGFAFVDHAHTHDLVHAACEDLKHLLRPGGLALFHDHNDDRNLHDAEYGVFQAVEDAFADRSFAFYGIYGCTGLFRRAGGSVLSRLSAAPARASSRIARSHPEPAPGAGSA